MSDQPTWLDGNALAGVLTEILGAELTASPRGCPSCGAVNAIGAHRLYRGAGWVLVVRSAAIWRSASSGCPIATSSR